jgi:hypothetical protein
MSAGPEMYTGSNVKQMTAEEDSKICTALERLRRLSCAV